MGRRLLMLEHTGRRSGLPRHVVLEVIGRGARGGPLVLSGTGERAQWRRNVTADPRVRLWWSTRSPRPARVERLAAPQAREAIATYADVHPRASRLLGGALEQLAGTTATPPVLEVVAR